MPIKSKSAEIDGLITEAIAITETEKNRSLMGTPKRIQVMVGIGRSWLGKLIGYNMIDFYNDVETRLISQLKSKVFLYENFDDDVIHKPEVGYDYGGAGTLECSLFGMGAVFDPHKECWVDGSRPVLKEPGDLAKLRIPDFYETRPMPLIHERYNELKRLVDGRLAVTFPGWSRGPWSVALFLRGFTELYTDIYDNPTFVKELLAFIAESRISWEKQRSDFLGKDYKDIDNWYSNGYIDYRSVHVSDQYSDEVDGAMLSPEGYEEFLFPSEKQLADFYGRVRYYHSCGNLTPFLNTLPRLRNLTMLHVSSWTDLVTACNITDPRVILQKVMHPEDDVLHATDEQIEKQIGVIAAAVPDRNLWICADALYDGDIEKVKNWLKIAKKVVSRYQ